MARAWLTSSIVGSVILGGVMVVMMLERKKQADALEDLRKQLDREKDLRKTERAGRTKAERRLRQELAALIENQTNGGLTLRPVARARTPFKGRCGTPRQGLLCPHTKGQIVFDQGISPVSLDSLDQFSHLWVIFLFDQNTNWTESTCSGKRGFTFTAKISPPRLFGKKVGVFSTRSPHRPNPIGLTVVRIDSVQMKEGIINISGIDICNGSPILDVKPYIPYDVVPDLRVPNWVTDVDIPAWDLLIEPEAEAGLRQLVNVRQSFFYPTYEDMVKLLKNVLLQDVRSVHQGRGKTKKEADDEPYRCNIDDTMVEFHTLQDAIHIVRAYEEIKDGLSDDEQEEEGLCSEHANKDNQLAT